MENDNPDVIPAIAPDPIIRKKSLFSGLAEKKLVIGLIALALAAAIIIVLLLILNPSSRPTDTTTAKPQQQLPAEPAPVFTATSYEDRSTLGTAANTTTSSVPVRVYPLQYNLTDSDVSSLKSKLGLLNTEFAQSTDDVELHSNTNGEQSEYLLINKKTGTFDFYTYKGLQHSTSTTPLRIAVETLEYLGMMDPTIACPITYQKTNVPGVIFVECHRMWNELGVPLLNPVGVLNMPESKLMATLSPGYADPLGAKDSTIINASNNQNGLSRPNDFNTIIVGVEGNGRVSSIVSTMKPFASKPVGSQQIISPKEAIAVVKQNKAEFTLTLPTGSGNVDLEKVYKNGSALSNKAIISDMLLAYIEKPAEADQSTYEPYYIVKGVAELESGYTVKFVQAVKAARGAAGISNSKLGDTIKSLSKAFIPQAHAVNQATPTTNPACTPAPEGPDCKEDSNFTEIKVFDIPGYGKLTVGRTGAMGNTYYLISTTGATDKQSLLMALAQGICPDLKIPDQIQACKNRYPRVFIDNGGKQYEKEIDPKCYITGMSPAIFLYPATTSPVTVKYSVPITYSDPPVRNNSITVLANTSGKITTPDGVSREYLYYEYDVRGKSLASNSNEGYIVTTATFEQAIRDVSSQLYLSHNETVRFIREVSNALSDKKGYYLLSFAEKEQVDESIPLSIFPAPDKVYRLHAVLEPADYSTLLAKPKFQPIIRNGFTVIEVGAFLKE